MQPVCKADNLTTPCAVVKKSENLNFLEPSGQPRPVTGLLLSLPASYFMSSDKMQCHVSYDMPRMFQTLLIICPHGDLTYFFHVVIIPTTTDDPYVQNPQLKFSHI
jgi:hypothetical protein